MKRTALACTLILLASVCAAETLPVTPDAVFTFNDQEFVITRTSEIDPNALNAIAQVNSSCTSPCLTPMVAAEGIATLGELDVISFLSSRVKDGDGLLVDARLPENRGSGFIPASVNIPAATVAPNNPFRDDILMALGAEQFEGIFTFNDAMNLVVFDDGPATQDAPSMINDLIAAGYPTDKISYYRGGMQVWAMLGLSTEAATQ